MPAVPAPWLVVPVFVDNVQLEVPVAPNCQPVGNAFVVDELPIELKFWVYDVPESEAAVVACAHTCPSTAISDAAIAVIARTIRHAHPSLRRCHVRPRWRGMRALRLGGRGVVRVVLDAVLVVLVAFMRCLDRR